jgi:hypothetical protein
MIRLLVLSLCFAGFSLNAFAGSFCDWEAQSLVQKMGGENLTMTSNSMTGWTVNDRGYTSYRFTRGNEVCGVTYDVFGTYFGVKCSEAWGGVYCSVPGKRKRR